MTALTLGISGNASTTLPSAELLVSATGATGGTAGLQTINTSTQWGELSLSSVIAYAGSATIGAPSGKGAFFDAGTSSLTNSQIFGNWSATLNFAISQAGKSVGCTLVLRMWKYNTSTTIFSAIGSITLTGQTFTSTSATPISFPSTPLNAMSFRTSESAYIDLWSNILTNTMTSGGQFGNYYSNSLTLGWTGAQIVTPGFLSIPPFQRIIYSGLGGLF